MAHRGLGMCAAALGEVRGRRPKDQGQWAYCCALIGRVNDEVLGQKPTHSSHVTLRILKSPFFTKPLTRSYTYVPPMIN